MKQHSQTLVATRHARTMDDVYRYQRYIYDLTRKYYLFGRDTLLDTLDIPDGARVLEIGCGTGRNLVLAARANPQALFYGFDISSQMLKTASAKAAKAGVDGRIFTVAGDAEKFDARRAFQVGGFQRVLFSYSLSMVPDWQRAFLNALDQLSPDGRLHIVDFGEMERWPGFARALMLKWLAKFHVEPRAGMASIVETLAKRRGLTASARKLAGGYAVLIVVSKDPVPSVQKPPEKADNSDEINFIHAMIP
ncbi:methyltransferase domain-containing protein [Anderseniella sp. Alg231-50]|uniref:methyltransferase domain-containing protein n=1 Tax=Anderseniella sp. Alg231-50 TaxID=1922226 RepID=UPI000D558232